MFRVFSDFNALFSRPRIRASLQEYQADLMKQVIEDFQVLQSKFRNGNHEVAPAARDLPPAASHIVWLKQFEYRVQSCLKRMEDVLGKQWDETSQGQKLKADSEAFLKQLNSTVSLQMERKDS